jgi:hypothetical protein
VYGLELNKQALLFIDRKKRGKQLMAPLFFVGAELLIVHARIIQAAGVYW